MFAQDPSAVLVVMDTLATSDDLPLMFMSKVTAFPHADMLVAGTGLAAVVNGWVDHLATQRVFRDISGARIGTPETLRQLHAATVGELTGPNLTSTIYHFGIERETGLLIRYVYRSTTGYREERSAEGGFGVKPTVDGGDPYGPVDDVDGFIAIAERVRAEQDGLGPGRIHIGGELILTALSGTGIQQVKIHTFEDYESDWEKAMLRTQNPFI